MSIEIERKFLVDNEKWDKVIKPDGKLIHQGYLHSDNNKTVRVRYTNIKGYITIKGKQVGISRPEFEYEIPLIDAIDLYNNFCESRIIKNRYFIEYSGFTWEVDEFMGENLGLITAEVELENESVQFTTIPDWILEDVTHDDKYKNSKLAK
jgi:CYTH domain-containing protein